MFGNRNVKAARKAIKRLDVDAFNAALARISEDKRPELLGDALISVVSRAPQDKTEAFLANLLKPGAKINYPGIVLARAIDSNQPTPVIKLICNHGGNFDETLTLMLNNRWGQNNIEKLKNQREIITGSREKIIPPPQESEEGKFRAAVLEKLDGIAAQYNDVSQRLARLEEAAGLTEQGPPQEAPRALRTTPINLS